MYFLHLSQTSLSSTGTFAQSSISVVAYHSPQRLHWTRLKERCHIFLTPSDSSKVIFPVGHTEAQDRHPMQVSGSSSYGGATCRSAPLPTSSMALVPLMSQALTQRPQRIQRSLSEAKRSSYSTPYSLHSWRIIGALGFLFISSCNTVFLALMTRSDFVSTVIGAVTGNMQAATIFFRPLSSISTEQRRQLPSRFSPSWLQRVGM